MALIQSLVISVCILECYCQGSKGPPRYTTRYGQVEGFWETSYEGRQYAAFEGIPYAKPPVGELKFEAPQPIKPWPGTWRATSVTKCMQSTLFYPDQISGVEDCLYLNIYKPITDGSRKLDVVIHIHGGGFVAGYGQEYTNAKYIMDRDIIFVTMQYRLGPLGFLSTGDEVLPGNNGLKDQVLALKWIKENIDSFGGNPNSITLTGFSAGAASVHYHYFSPLSRNLFTRGMSISGSALNTFALHYNPAKRAEALGRALRCDIYNKKVMVDCIKSRPATMILNVTATDVNPCTLSIRMPFLPVLEKKSQHAFLSEHPYKLLKQGKVLDLPWITSTTSHEGLILSIPSINNLDEIEENWKEVAKYMLFFEDAASESIVADISQKIKDFYFPSGEKIDQSNFHIFTKLVTDRLFSIDAELAVKLQAEVTNSPVYYYKFHYESSNSFKNLLTSKKMEGACHGEDMVYFFGGFITEPLSEKDIKLKNIALDVLYVYAHEGKTKIPNITWSPVGKEFSFLNITGPDNIQLQTKTDYSTEDFWNSLGLLERENLGTNVKTEL